MNIETILKFKNDLDSYKFSDLHSIGTLYDFPDLSDLDLKWLIAIKHSRDNMFATMDKPEISKEEFLKNFKIGDLLGEGQGAHIYSVTNVKTNEQLAVKICKKSPSARRQCERELYYGTTLNHPNIINVKEFYNVKDMGIAIIMEKCVGGDLYIKTDELTKILTEEETAKILKPLIMALGYLADQNVIHRDLKPENIFFCGPNGDIPKLADFGLAIDYDPTNKPIGHTGSLAYMPPEMSISYPKKYDPSIDLRALGVIMYELLTSVYPYDPENVLSDPELMKAIEYNNRRGDAKQEYKNLSAEAKDLIDSLLGKNNIIITSAERPTANDVLNHQWFKNLETM
uniref:Putative serine/threonine protein kinase n=1 Tax=Marseillevirus LCMAC201 TaxID=2506605 RepID=A0A481YX59_9VIRU|nr:MAG: putative serine/threonine protein kinase [Marseillevirus LCMAC201]